MFSLVKSKKAARFKMGAFFELQDWRELMADIVDDVEKMLDRCTEGST